MSWSRRGSGLLAAGALLLAGGLVAPTTASAAPVSDTNAGITYAADDGDVSAGATVTGFDGSTTTVTIPDTIEIASTDYDVVAIDSGVFENESLTSVDLGDKLSEIGQNAFANNELTNLTLPDSVATIDDYAFAYNKLASLTLPDSVTTIGVNAFRDNELTSLTLGDSVAIIGEYAFAFNELTSLTLPDWGTTISAGAFAYNELASLTLPDSVTTIGAGAFARNNLTSLTLPDSVSGIGEDSFGRNPGLVSVVFTGSAPTVEPASGGSDPSFDTSSKALVLSFPWRYGTPQTTGGYETPVWEGYDAQAVATVDFDLNGQGSSAPGDQDVVVGGLATEPTAPNASGYVFTGWFTDVALTDQFDFSTAVAGDLTLYASWQQEQEEPEDYVSVSKTVDASYVRVFDWDLTKSGEVAEVIVDGDTASADVDYTVTATPQGDRNAYHVLRGEITVTNNYLEPLLYTITDEPEVGVDATCSVYNSDGAADGEMSIDALEEITFDYQCTLDGTPADGTNTVEVIWSGGEGQASATEDVVFEERDTSFDTVNIGDDKTTPENGFVDLGEAQWGADGIPAEFNYTLTQSDLPVGECTSFTNTAMIAQTEQSAQATVEICPEPAADPEPTPTPTSDPTPTPATDPNVPAAAQTGGLAKTGSDVTGPVGAALLLIVAGGAAILIRRKVKN